MNSTDTGKQTAEEEPFNVLVLATGLVKAKRYVKDYQEVARRALKGIVGLEAMLDREVDTVLTRGSYHLEQELDQIIHTEVESAYFRWLGFMNDPAIVDEQGNTSVPAVREDDQPRIDTDPDDIKDLNWSEISDERISRAKAKAGAKMNHFLFDEYYEDYPNVEAVITLNCGSHRGLGEIRDARGNNIWVDGQAGHVKQTVDINVQDQILYSRVMIEGNNSMEVEDLHTGQIDELRDNLSPEELKEYNIAAAPIDEGANQPTAA